MFDSAMLRITRKLMRGLNTDLSLSILADVEAGRWSQVVQYRIDPTCYSDPLAYKKDAQAVDFLRKCAGLDTGIKTAGVAVKKFWAAEAQCAATNKRFKELALFHHGGEDERIVEFLERVKSLLKRMLGSIPKQLKGRFGPGAVFESKGLGDRLGFSLGDKIGLNVFVTDEARAIFEHYYWPSSWGRAHLFVDGQNVSQARGNRFTTVPKDATTDRGICIEPGGNVYLQLALGEYLKERLLKFGIDLRGNPSQGTSAGQVLHQALARIASRRGHLSTIDLASASDTIARELVKYLLPREWYELLDALRSRRTLIDGRWVYLEKFSSMGNGFTFELETMIFTAIAKVVCSDECGRAVSVYGDDIIVPTEHAADVLAALKYAGFTPNVRKTFTTGKFRESCGGDFFDGVDVRPHLLKELPSEPAAFISLANGLRRRWDQPDWHNSPVYRCWLAVLDCLPADIRRTRGPSFLGDLVVFDPDESRWDVVRKQYRGAVEHIRVWRPIQARKPLNRYAPLTLLAAILYGGVDPRGFTPRGRTTGFRFGRIPLVQYGRAQLPDLTHYSPFKRWMVTPTAGL